MPVFETKIDPRSEGFAANRKHRLAQIEEFRGSRDGETGEMPETSFHKHSDNRSRTAKAGVQRFRSTSRQ